MNKSVKKTSECLCIASGRERERHVSDCLNKACRSPEADASTSDVQLSRANVNRCEASNGSAFSLPLSLYPCSLTRCRRCRRGSYCRVSQWREGEKKEREQTSIVAVAGNSVRRGERLSCKASAYADNDVSRSRLDLRFPLQLSPRSRALASAMPREKERERPRTGSYCLLSLALVVVVVVGVRDSLSLLAPTAVAAAAAAARHPANIDPHSRTA